MTVRKVGRFRESGLAAQLLLTIAAGALLSTCWLLRLWFSQPTVETVLALIATVLCGGPIIWNAVKSLVNRQVNVDELVSLAIIASLIIGEYLTAALSRAANTNHRWCGRHVRIVDGSSVSMPDTPALQEVFPQPERQKAGCGFPVARLVALLVLYPKSVRRYCAYVAKS